MTSLIHGCTRWGIIGFNYTIIGNITIIICQTLMIVFDYKLRIHSLLKTGIKFPNTCLYDEFYCVIPSNKKIFDPQIIVSTRV